jgi:hypothetical protein
MEGVLRRRAAAIVQQKDGWHGITFTVKDREIGELNLYSNRNLGELKSIVEGIHYGVALDNGSAFLFNLTFPFSDRRKIRLVIGNELEQRLPVSLDDMEVSFVEIGKGKILAATISKMLADDLRKGRQMRITTVQSLAALHALKWFRLVPEENFVFLHISGNAVVLMAFKERNLYYLRQFFHSPESESLRDAFAEITEDSEFIPRSYIMVGDNGEAEPERKRIEQEFHIGIERPSLRRTLKNDDVPDWCWAGIGSALLSIKTNGQLNLTGKASRYSFLSSNAGAYACACLASIGVVVCGLSYLDYVTKERVHTYLSGEPLRIYRTAFPKSPPVRDPMAMFRDKIKLLEKESGSISVSASPLTVLNEVSHRIPPELDIKLNEFSFDDKEFVISGTTISFAAVEKVKADIEQIKGVSLVEAQNLELAGNKQVKFKLRGKL